MDLLFQLTAKPVYFVASVAHYTYTNIIQNVTLVCTNILLLILTPPNVIKQLHKINIAADILVALYFVGGCVGYFLLEHVDYGATVS